MVLDLRLVVTILYATLSVVNFQVNAEGVNLVVIEGKKMPLNREVTIITSGMAKELAEVLVRIENEVQRRLEWAHESGRTERNPLGNY